MARETIPSECFSGAWKWEKDNTVFMIVHDFSTWEQFRCTFLQTVSMQQTSSCSSLSSGLKYFLSSTYQSDYMMSTIWNKPAKRYLDHSVSDVLHSFHVPQLQCLYLSVLLTNQDVDSNTVFTLILLLQILRIRSPFWLALTLSVLQRLSHLRLQSALSSTLWGLFVFRLPGAGRNKGLSELSKILVIFTQRIRHC